MIQARTVLLAATCLLGAAMAAPASAAPAASWPAWGGPLAGNQRSAPAEQVIGAGNVASLAVRWTFTTKGDVLSTPAVDATGVYATDDGGGVWRIDPATGRATWTQSMAVVIGRHGAFSRSSPALTGALVIVTDKVSGTVVALNKGTGAKVWATQVDHLPAASGGASPVVIGNVVLVGTSSREEGLAKNPNYTLAFRGSVAALDLATGRLLWQTSTAPDGYTGAPVWGSAFAVSRPANAVYVATGNNYSVPAAAGACLATAIGTAAQLACLDPADYVDAILALDLTTGAVKWAQRVQGADTYNDTCGSGSARCPAPAGSDYDFAAQPLLFSGRLGGRVATLVGDGQKSGVFWALNPASGAIVWHTTLGPGGGLGGMQFGSATDGSRLYVAENDTAHVPYVLTPSGATVTGGSWAALDGATGRILWQVPAPGVDLVTPGEPAGAESAITVANGVVLGGTTGGAMVALDAATGAQLWSFATGATVNAGPAVSNGAVYWGSGAPNGVRGTTLYAFAPQ